MDSIQKWNWKLTLMKFKWYIYIQNSTYYNPVQKQYTSDLYKKIEHRV